MAVIIHGFISHRDRQSRGQLKAPKIVAVERALAHVKYIQHRPGRDKEGGAARDFFNESENRLDGKELREAIKGLENSKVVLHKLTLAPEIEPLDRREYTREVMDYLAREKGLDLDWMAVAHGNTDHAHIHVVVLGKDKNGKSVWIGKNDYPKLREHGDRYLERWQPLELERSRQRREEKKRERLTERKKEKEIARQERIAEGLELPWMHRKLLREQLEPYKEWKDKEAEKERPEAIPKREETSRDEWIEAAGKNWSPKNSLSELRDLNQHLWDNYDERLPRPEYKKLIAWIKEKEKNEEKSRTEGKSSDAGPEQKSEQKEKDSFWHAGKKYGKDSSYEVLSELSGKLREGKVERLPIDEYQKLRGWLERADRARWSGALEKQVELSKAQYAKEGAQKNMPHMQRAQNPIQEQALRNPVIGLFMTGASVANELVRWIPLTDQRDRLKEAGDALEAAKQDKHKQYVEPGREQESKARDKEGIERLDEAIDENKKKREDEKKKRKEKERDDDNPFKRDPWGRW